MTQILKQVKTTTTEVVMNEKEVRCGFYIKLKSGFTYKLWSPWAPIDQEEPIGLHGRNTKETYSAVVAACWPDVDHLITINTGT